MNPAVGVVLAAVLIGTAPPDPEWAGPSHTGPRQHVVAAPAISSTAEPEQDHWLGSDKWRHLLLSYAATTFTFAGMRSLGVDRDNALAGGIVVGGTLGIGKEIRDLRRGRRFSVRDLVADAAGVAVAAFLMREVR